MSTMLALFSGFCGITALISMKHGTPSGVAAALLLAVILAGSAIAI